jgi:hypothetical protein
VPRLSGEAYLSLPYLNISVDPEEDEQMIRLRVCLVEIGNQKDTAQAATAGHCASNGRLVSGLAIKNPPKKTH